MLFERGDKGFGSDILRVEREIDFSRHGGEKFFQRGRPNAGERFSEPGARVQPGYYVGRNVSDRTGSICCAAQIAVVQEKEPAIARRANVELDEVRAHANRFFESRKRVLGSVPIGAAVVRNANGAPGNAP